MTKRMISRKITIYSIFSLVLISAFSSAHLASGIMSTETLFYSDFIYLGSEEVLSRWSSISWSFTRTNTYISITVIAMTEENFLDFVDGYIYFGYTLSEGSNDVRSGTFKIPDFQDETKWYLIFWHNDLSRILESTSVTASIEFNSILLTLLTILIPAVLGMAIIIVIFVLIIRNKRQREKR